MSNAIKHYGLCCAGSHCVQTNQVVTLLLICSICANAMHESCGVTSGDHCSICFPCHGDNVAVALEDVCNVSLAAEFSIEESSDRVNFQPASFPSSNELWLSSFNSTGEGAALQSAPQLENNSSFTITESVGKKVMEEGKCIHATKDFVTPLTSTDNLKKMFMIQIYHFLQAMIYVSIHAFITCT
jgi:hypothetical protein